MGAILPVAIQALKVAATVGTVAQTFNNAREQSRSSDLALRQLQQQQALNQKISIDNANLERQKIFEVSQVAEKERRLALKRAIARQRAEFGGSGVASGDGSSEAVLLGLFEESDDEKKARERLDKIKLQGIDQDLRNLSRTNTLKYTQAKEKEKINVLGDGLNSFMNIADTLESEAIKYR
jgi:hypothetical protein